jgi:hypothetical protein
MDGLGGDVTERVPRSSDPIHEIHSIGTATAVGCVDWTAMKLF